MIQWEMWMEMIGKRRFSKRYFSLSKLCYISLLMTNQPVVSADHIHERNVLTRYDWTLPESFSQVAERKLIILFLSAYYLDNSLCFVSYLIENFVFLSEQDFLPHQQRSEQFEKLEEFKPIIERMIRFLSVPKSNIMPSLKDKVDYYEKQIIVVLNMHMPRVRPRVALQQGQLPQSQTNSRSVS